MAVKLGDLLLKQKLITQQQLDTALKLQREEGGKIGEALVRVGAVSEADITETLSQQFGVPSIDLAHFEIDPGVIKVVPGEVARKYGVLPVNKTGATLTIAMGDPTNVFAMDDIKFMTGYNVEPVVASEIALRKAIDKHYGTPRSVVLKEKAKSSGGQSFSNPEGGLDDVMASSALTMDDMASVGLGELNMDEITGIDTGADVDVVKGDEGQEIDLSDLAKSSESAPIIKVSNLILIEALKAGASDIHVEPYEKEFRVRFRIDGILHNIMALPMRTRDPLISRLKIMAKLDISEKRLPQDGRIKIRLRVEERSRDLDLRVSSVPTHFGEKVVMRLLDKSKLQLDMTQLGFDQEPLRRFKDAIDRPYGIVLVTGPTGSGKTNTLYSAIAALNDPTVNIMTAEDPIEFNLAGINQVQMKEQIGLTFASALRSFLRQDPDIILVGEIRDFETAEIAVKAALTGHLVLSTLHTNDAPSTINRLMNMGIEPFLVATSVNCICAQRLVRRICTQCPEEMETPPQMLIQVGFAPDEVKTLKVKRGRGCDRCNNTGYKGRVGLFEVLAFTDEIRDMILSGASSIELKRKAIEEGMVSLRMSGLQKIREGQTTLEEVLRETVL
ncbi:MAG TPA: type IV-A pilus assembly ATPase PilB [Thermoanaerobaculia bacterium]|jgi:type IV pilus assembly protein PilB|nr:type IV-A pilus assembly ATPase PilB [Thermoanaerobaculia bacterium]